jgi:ElaB/YqjD/DUF883 family membrane-anchored ribosome-binding protein
MKRSGYMARTDSEEMTSADIEILKADIQKLRDDLGDMLGSVGSYSKEKLADTRNKLMAAVDDLQGKAYDRLQGTARTVRDRSHRAVDMSRGAVEQKPLTYVVTAFIAGVILASFFGWKKSSCD